MDSSLLVCGDNLFLNWKNVANFVENIAQVVVLVKK